MEKIAEQIVLFYEKIEYFTLSIYYRVNKQLGLFMEVLFTPFLSKSQKTELTLITLLLRFCR